MKRALLLFLLFFCIVTTTMAANKNINGYVLDFTYTILAPEYTLITCAPQAMPIVRIEGHILFLNNIFFKT